MSKRELPEYPTPVIRIQPNGDVLGEIVGAVADLDDSIMRFLTMDEYGYPEILRYGIKQVDSKIQLQTLDVDVDLFTFKPYPLSWDGDMGIAMMVLANFVRDAFIAHLRFDPMYKEEGKPGNKFPIWRRNLLITHRDPMFGSRRRESYGFFVTFPKFDLTAEQHNLSALASQQAAYVKSLFDYRDRAWEKLDCSMRGKMVSTRDDVIKGK